MSSRLRRVCFTVNNPTDKDLEDLNNSEAWAYLIWTIEHADGKGTPHVQGYGELKAQQRFSWLQKWCPRAHFEGARGSAAQNLAYCTKEGSLDFEHGTPRRQGERNDLDAVRASALEGGMREVVTWGNLQQIRVAEKYLSYHEEQRSWKPTVHWIWGPTGVGKSAKAEAMAGSDAYWMDDRKWWEGYDGHEVVILDEFRGTWWTLTYMLRLLDRYPFRVEFKGGSRQFLARTVIITSCYPPELAYRNCGEAIGQLIRRIDSVTEMGAPEGTPPVSEVGGNTMDPSPIDLDEVLEGLI